MKRILFIALFCTACILCANAQQEKPDPNFHIYLLTGQSNMAGRAPLDSESKKIDPRIMMLNKENEWVPATDPVHFDKPDVAAVGPALSFAKEMIRGNKTIKIGLIPCAVGGSPIRVWEPDSTYLNGLHPYDDAIKRAKIGMQKGVLKGIIWHQGESDNNSVASVAYLDKLRILVNRFRADLSLPGLPFVAGEIGYFNKTTLINPIINQLPILVQHTTVVSAEGLTDKGDGIHFDTRSARQLGIRYAEAMKKL